MASKTSSGMKTHLEYMNVVGLHFQSKPLVGLYSCLCSNYCCVFSSSINRFY